MNTKQLEKALEEALEIAGEAIFLANEYAGGESTSANALDAKLQKLESRIGRSV